MTLEERVARLEEYCQELRHAGELASRGALAHMRNYKDDEKRIGALEAQLKELDVMVLAIHAAIKDVQERV